MRKWSTNSSRLELNWSGSLACVRGARRRTKTRREVLDLNANMMLTGKTMEWSITLWRQL
jgi:hypothetical protein